VAAWGTPVEATKLKEYENHVRNHID
jgi:hypothetical protein